MKSWLKGGLIGAAPLLIVRVFFVLYFSTEISIPSYFFILATPLVLFTVFMQSVVVIVLKIFRIERFFTESVGAAPLGSGEYLTYHGEFIAVVFFFIIGAIAGHIINKVDSYNFKKKGNESFIKTRVLVFGTLGLIFGLVLILGNVSCLYGFSECILEFLGMKIILIPIILLGLLIGFIAGKIKKYEEKRKKNKREKEDSLKKTFMIFMIFMIFIIILYVRFISIEKGPLPTELNASEISEGLLIQKITIKNNFILPAEYNFPKISICAFDSKNKVLPVRLLIYYKDSRRWKPLEKKEFFVEYKRVEVEAEIRNYINKNFNSTKHPSYMEFEKEVVEFWMKNYDELLVFENSPSVNTNCNYFSDEDIANAKRIKILRDDKELEAN
jgi:hypothetical protein